MSHAVSQYLPQIGLAYAAFALGMLSPGAPVASVRGSSRGPQNRGYP